MGEQITTPHFSNAADARFERWVSENPDALVKSDAGPGYTPRTFSTYDEVVSRPGEQVAHLLIEDVNHVELTICGEFTHEMTETRLMDSLDPEWRCPKCFPDENVRYPRSVCSRCGDLVSTRPEKAEKRIARPEGGWDHAAGVCLAASPSGQSEGDA